MIRIKGLHKFFNKGKQNEIHVINDVDLELPDRGMVAIFGRSGCGKTTLLNVIGGLDGFQSGSLTVDGESIRQDPDTIRNRMMGYIFQNYNLNKSESCYDNVADALRLCGMEEGEEMERRVMAALTNVDMERYRSRTPDTLSGGQQQRIAIARAIVKNPRIILADEPTGNLDEANTVLIMDLLRQIAKDHLVLLVTHEANLVDSYCDMVVELQDGRVASIRQNQAADGFEGRNKNDVYLGELDKSELRNAATEIEYFGEAPDEPIRLRIVNSGGKLYMQIQSAKVQILDESSEIRLREGVFESRAEKKERETAIDMSALPPVQGKRFGRLFSFASSIKSGYVANFRGRKKGKKLLLTCMALFSAVLVLMTSVMGTAFQDLIEVDNAYNHNVFYVYTPDGDVSSKLNEAVGSEASGIDGVTLYGGNLPNGNDAIFFNTGHFESFATMSYSSDFRSPATLLSASHAKGLELVEGRNTDLGNSEILITTAVADHLLANSSLGYIREYRDLLGLVASNYSVDGEMLRVAGIVRSKETSIYLNELSLSRYVLGRVGKLNVRLASDYGLTVEDGKTLYLCRSEKTSDSTPQKGQSIKVHGKSLVISEVKKLYFDYMSWCEANGKKRMEMEEWLRLQVEQDSRFESLVPESEEWYIAYENLRNERYFDYYINHYYGEIDAFLRERAVFENSLDLWLYTEKQVDLIRFVYMMPEMYQAEQFRAANGRYPTMQEGHDQEVMSRFKPYHEAYDEAIKLYQDEYHMSRGDKFNMELSSFYLVSDADYIALSQQYGETHETASLSFTGGIVDGMIKETVIIGGSDMSMSYSGNSKLYTVVHSSDPEKTDAWLREQFPTLTTSDNRIPAILAPSTVRDNLMSDKQTQVVQQVLTMVVILVLMSICMFFIMRSSLMSRIKEVGIYRAIGVSKKNLVFRFFMEAVVLTTLTVMVGFLITSAVMRAWLGFSSMMSSLFYYPLWLCGALLVILYAVCLFCGTVPILSLLRRKPSEILAKYDI